MKTLLMHPDRDFDPKIPMPPQERHLRQDLELDVLVRVMMGGDDFIGDVAWKALFSGWQNDTNTILYRQEIVKDCLKNPAVVQQLYAFAVEAIEGRKKHYFGFVFRSPSSVLSSSIGLMQLFMHVVKKIRGVVDLHGSRFASRGFMTVFAMLQEEFSDGYLARVQNHLAELKFKSGVLVSAALGEGTKGTNYVLRTPRDKKPKWQRRILGKRQPAYSFRIHERDETGARILSELKGRGINLTANALAQAADHILGFFVTLRRELAFYVGCLNLHDRLAAIGAPLSFPRPHAIGTRKHQFKGLYDICLALTVGRSIVGNSINGDRMDLVIVTGANQGGKSTFLRSIGLAQLMMQSGMFVAAESFAAELCRGLYTHYKREEDATMKSGKLDEELQRMSGIVELIAPNAFLLLNESFAATNEREGSEIARQIVGAMLEKHVKLIFVTHLYEFARTFFEQKWKNVLFLRAERGMDGTRTYALVEAAPLETSYGRDLYEKIFTVGSIEQDTLSMAE